MYETIGMPRDVVLAREIGRTTLAEGQDRLGWLDGLGTRSCASGRATCCTRQNVKRPWRNKLDSNASNSSVQDL